jgi:hypothetical protein
VVFESSSYKTVHFDFVVASDLMSDVLTSEGQNMLLITSLVSDQVIRTADIVGACAVIIAQNKTVPESMFILAKELDISVLSAPWPKFELCVRLGTFLRNTEH